VIKAFTFNFLGYETLLHGTIPPNEMIKKVRPLPILDNQKFGHPKFPLTIPWEAHHR